MRPERGNEQAVNRAQNTRFTRSRWADKTNKFSRGNFEAYSFHDGFLTITQGEIENAEHLFLDDG